MNYSTSHSLSSNSKVTAVVVSLFPLMILLEGDLFVLLKSCMVQHHKQYYLLFTIHDNRQSTIDNRHLKGDLGVVRDEQCLSLKATTIY
jgi:hypothetical protein